MNFEQLENEFGIKEQLEFVEGQGNLHLVHIRNKFANAIISTYAGQVLSYKPVDQEEDLLFLSEAAYFQQGKAIKGGIPVCWPWFGPDPEDKGRAAHGFVRNRERQVMATESLPDGSTSITLGIDSDEDTLGIWPVEFELRIQITVGDSLDVKLSTTNRSEQDITISQALHTYFRVGEISRAQVEGLEGNSYIDKLDNQAVKTQQGAVTIAAEVDRIYTDVNNSLIINDESLQRRLNISSTGSHSAVVWNPWVEVAKSMGDLLDEEYQSMLCVETTNAGPDTVNIPAGDTYTLGASYSITK